MSLHRPSEFGLTLLMLGAAAAQSKEADVPAPAIHKSQWAQLAFDIPALPLADALAEFGTQSGLHMVADAALAQGRRSGQVRGRFTTDAALDRLLSNTGLGYRYLDDQTIMLVLPDAPRPVAYTQQAVGQVLAAAQAQPAEAQEDELQEVVVRGQNFTYNKLESANKMPMSIKETPQSVKIITQDMLHFAGVTKINDTYKLDAGGYAGHLQEGYTLSYFRGFENGYLDSFKVDGFRVIGDIKPDLAPYERVEMVKGAISTVYGQSAVAGTVNAVSKKPQAGPLAGSVSLETGAWNHYRGEFDAYGSISADDRLQFRFVGAYMDEDSYLDFTDKRQFVIAPSLRYEFSDRTSVLLQLNYQDFNYATGTGFPVQFLGGDAGDAANYQIPDVPNKLFGVSGSWARTDQQSMFMRATLEHSFANDWKLRGNLQYVRSDIKTKRAWIGAFNPLPAEGPVDTYLYFLDGTSPAYSGEVNLFGDVELFGRKHVLFFGADYSHLKQTTHPVALGLLPGTQTGFSLPNLDYSRIPDPSSIEFFAPGGVFGEGGGIVQEYDRRPIAWGVTAQAILKPTDRLAVHAGLRYSHSEQKLATHCCDYSLLEEPLPPFEEEIKAQQAVTFQSGLTYDVKDNVTVYATFGESFYPRNDYAFDPENPLGRGTFLGPDQGITYETGVKGELFGQELFWSVALFYTARTNITQTDFEHFGSPYVYDYAIELGRQRSKGVEVELQGKILPGWDAFLSAAAMNNEFSEGEFAGVVSPFGPKFGITAYTSYTIQSGALRGFGMGGGVVYKDRPDFELDGLTYPQLFPSFTEVDLRAFYDAKPWLFEISATNVLDERYFSPSYLWLGGQININPPRQVLVKVTRSF